MVGRDRSDRAVAQRVEQRGAIVLGAQRGIHLHVRVERAHGFVRQAEVVRRRLAAGADACLVRAAQVLHGFARREVHQMNRLPRVAREVDVTRDHQALAERRPAAETELGRDRAGVGMPAPRQRLLLAVHGDHAARDRVVLQRAPHDARGRDRAPVVREAGRARVGERAHLGQLARRRAPS